MARKIPKLDTCNHPHCPGIYLDFAKAFDTVPHERLLVKLKNCGVSGGLLSWLEAFLKNRKQRVVVNGSPSSWSEVTSGIPQGTVLGPLLFVIFINDMPTVTESLLNLLADDSKLWRQIDSEDDADTIQRDLDNLTSWSNTWQLWFNAGKCIHAPIGNPPHNSYQMLDLNTNTRVDLKEKKCEKHLGVFIDSDLSFDHHINYAVNKANSILGMIRRTYSYLGANDFKMIYTALVRPILEYGSVVWNPALRKHIDSLENVQRRFTKFLPGLRDVPYEDRLRRLSLPTLYFRRFRGDMIDVWKLTHGIYKIDVSTLLTIDPSEGRRTRGHSLKLRKPRCRTSKRANFFSQRVINEWHGTTCQRKLSALHQSMHSRTVWTVTQRKMKLTIVTKNLRMRHLIRKF